MKHIFKSTGVVMLGFALNAILSIVTDFLLESIGVLPKPEMGLFGTGAILLVLLYRAVYTILTGFVVARLAPNKPMLHAVVLGAIAVVITAMAVANPAFSAKSRLWFGYTLIAITIPCLWLGVKIQQNWSK